MNLCYIGINNYGWAIVIFTFISKIVLLPISIWVQKNSIKMVKMQPEINEIKVKHFGDKDTIAEMQSQLYKKYKYNAFASVIPMVIQIALLIALISVIKDGLQISGVDSNFYDVQLGEIPIVKKGPYILIPLIAGMAAYLLCFVQNRVNVLQANSSKFEKYFTMLVSVGLSFYLGFYVQVGVIIYWIASNLFGILQIFALNAAINPNKYIDYERLEKSRAELSELEGLEKKNKRSTEDKRRERQDYKRFFSIGNKHLVFYSENSGFYKYFKGIIEYILRNTNITIHYITSDPNDKIFDLEKSNNHIKAYYIGQTKLITLMMKMDADIVVMTTPDLDNYQIKRSYVRKDIEYIYVQHHMGSVNMILRKGSVDNFDTVFISGTHHEDEIRATEKCYGLKPKRLVKYGFPLLDEMIRDFDEKKDVAKENKTILIAPSWHNEGIMNTCIEDLLVSLLGTSYKVIVRPHPQYVRHYRESLESLSTRYANTNIEIQFDFSSNETVFDADCLMTDWSSIAFEYAFTTGRPVLFVDTPMKVHNPEYQKIDVVPFDVWIRNKVGISIKPEEAKEVKAKIENLFIKEADYKQSIFELRDNNIYNIGNASEYGAKYIISSIQEKIEKRKGQKNEK